MYASEPDIYRNQLSPWLPYFQALLSLNLYSVATTSMRTLIFILQCITTAAATTSFSPSSTLAAYTTSSSLSSQSSTTSDTSICDGNTATTRQQWCSYDIYTDYTTTVPETGVIR
jgi:hypothetical protein